MIIVVMNLKYKYIMVCFIDPPPPPQLVRQSRGTYDMGRGEFSMKNNVIRWLLLS